MQNPDHAIVVALAGEVDLAVRDQTAAVLDEATERALVGDVDLVVDLSAVTFMDSTGLSCLARATSALQAEGHALHLRRPGPPTRRLLELAGLDGLVAEGLTDSEG